jgi:hypothetical protein
MLETKVVAAKRREKEGNAKQGEKKEGEVAKGAEEKQSDMNTPPLRIVAEPPLLTTKGLAIGLYYFAPVIFKIRSRNTFKSI